MNQNKKTPRLDRDGTHRAQFEKNKKKIYATQSICALCGKPVDKTLKWPHPLSKSVDHIIPVSKGGHPSDIQNLQLAHLCCNGEKSSKMIEPKQFFDDERQINNRELPLSMDWKEFKKAKK